MAGVKAAWPRPRPGRPGRVPDGHRVHVADAPARHRPGRGARSAGRQTRGELRRLYGA